MGSKQKNMINIESNQTRFEYKTMRLDLNLK